MPIICFEGPSAVGKTTTALTLANAEGATVVREVNELFERPANASSTWYFERQVERWGIASEHMRSKNLCILDGDPFQPLWYNWAYGFAGWQDLDALVSFYRPEVVRGNLGFPDLYVLFSADEDALRERKEGDQTRTRRGFETHLQFIEPQRRYFKAMRTFEPEAVQFIDAVDIDTNVRLISNASRKVATQRRTALERFDYLVRWLRENPA